MKPRRRVVVPLLSTVIALLLSVLAVSPAVASASVAAPSTASLPRPLVVMSYNIHAGADSAGVYDFDRIAATVRRSGASVVALQEVDRHWSDRSDFDDVAAELGRRLHMHSYVAPIYSNDPATAGGPRAEYGVAVLSAWPVLETTNHEITRLSTQTTDPVPAPAPGFAEVVVNVAGLPVHVYSTHLDYRAEPSVRAVRATETVAIMAQDAGPKILMGDMNAPADAPELAPLHAAYRDAWTAGRGAGLSYPSIVPESRIDQILLSSTVRPLRSWVPDSLASDHRPVASLLLVRR